ncbi:hypothetical protein V8E54_002604 [Elaphomyces granulatus]
MAFATLKGKSQKRKEWQKVFHLYENCSYLHESIRPQGWIPNQAVLDKIAKKLEENSRLKHNIENCKKRIAGKTEDASKDATVRRSRNSTDKEKEGQTDDDLTLIRRSWSTVSPNPVKHVIAGERKDPISGYVTMTVHCKPANGKKECRIEAHNAHYIPTFHTNLISYDKATILEQGDYKTLTRAKKRRPGALATESTQSAVNKSMINKVIRISDVGF